MAKNNIKKIIFLLTTIFIFIFTFGLSACGNNVKEYKLGHDYRTTDIWGAGLEVVDNVITDYNGHKTFGVVNGSVWGAYVSAGNGYFVYKITPEENLTFSQLVLNMEAYFSMTNVNNVRFWEYEGRGKTNILISYSYDKKSYTEIYNFYDKHEDDFTFKKENSYVGDNALKLDILTYYKTNSPLYIRVDMIHPSYDTFSLDDLKSLKKKTFFGGTGGKCIELHCLAIRMYSVFITGKMVTLSK